MILSSTRSTHARSRPSGHHDGRSGDPKSAAKNARRFEPRQRTLAHSQRRHLNEDSSIGFSATNAEVSRVQEDRKSSKSKPKVTRVRTTPNSLAVMTQSGYHGATAAATKTLARVARKTTATAAAHNHPLTPPTKATLDAFISHLILEGRGNDAVDFLMEQHGMSRGDARGYVIDVELPKMEELPKSPPLVAIQKDTKDGTDRSPTGVRDLALVTPDVLSLPPPVSTVKTPNNGGGNGQHVLEAIVQDEEEHTVWFGEGSDYYFHDDSSQKSFRRHIAPPIFKVGNHLSNNACKLAPSTDDKLYGIQFLDDGDEECEYESFDNILPPRPPQNIFACILQALRGVQW